MQEAREPQRRPDPRPLRMAFGVTGVVAMSALATAIIAPTTPSMTSSDAANAPGQPVATTVVEQAVNVKHVKRYIHLKPGQTPPPKAVVAKVPTPTPRVVIVQAPAAPRVVVTTRQSGKP